MKLLALRFAKRIFGVRVAWVAHNAKPHDMAKTSILAPFFIRTLDGIIYLSAYSREVITALYAPGRHTRELITVHGHYRTATAAATKPPPLQNSCIQLLYFGQIRRYKNVDELIARIAELNDDRLFLTVAGTRKDETFAVQIEEAASSNPHIHLDLRQAPIPEPELEAMIDACHAVVLPYRDILNSGAALLALSRNRPILAPRRGSLPELQAKVGEDWVYLYDGDLSAEILHDFLTWLSLRRAGEVCDLSAFDWEPIGRSLGNFIGTLHKT
ncbi:MAG TPA: hypothetical protein VL574_05470 [Stellaceae bacterium]|nr:hypothetical protein [Stellaceae bacterium]